mgnify:CR=1 FL=1
MVKITLPLPLQYYQGVFYSNTFRVKKRKISPLVYNTILKTRLSVFGTGFDRSYGLSEEKNWFGFDRTAAKYVCQYLLTKALESSLKSKKQKKLVISSRRLWKVLQMTEKREVSHYDFLGHTEPKHLANKFNQSVYIWHGLYFYLNVKK